MTSWFQKTLHDDDLNLGILLFINVLYVFVIPLLPVNIGVIAMISALTLILFLSSNLMGRYRRLFWWCSVVVVILEILTETTDLQEINFISKVVRNVFLIAIIWKFVSQVASQKDITIKSVLRVLNGYLLLGVVFTSLIALVQYIDPNAYNFPEAEEDAIGNLVYYTFITMTTVGYGDIVPQSPIAKSVTTAIAVSGQFYVAVLIALIVGKYVGSQSE